MPKITYLKGDATEPIHDKAVICHVCNDIGGWGRGFVLALSKKWPEPEREYRKWFKDPSLFEDAPFGLGQTLFVPVKDSQQIIVANMVAQRDTVSINDVPPIRYDALENCLKDVFAVCKKLDWTLHAPMFGAGLAGGKWERIEEIILKYISVPTFIYKLI